jgi:hypothetical protein
MERTITINYYWKQVDGSDVKPHHVEYLEESAESRINSQMLEGYTEGELLDNLSTVDDPRDEDGTDYKGYWSVVKS